MEHGSSATPGYSPIQKDDETSPSHISQPHTEPIAAYGLESSQVDRIDRDRHGDLPQASLETHLKLALLPNRSIDPALCSPQDDHSEITSSLSSSSGLGRTFSSMPSMIEVATPSFGLNHDLDPDVDHAMDVTAVPSKDSLPQFLRRQCVEASVSHTGSESKELAVAMTESTRATPLTAAVARQCATSTDGEDRTCASFMQSNDRVHALHRASASNSAAASHSGASLRPLIAQTDTPVDSTPPNPVLLSTSSPPRISTSYAYSFQPTGRRLEKLQLERDVAPILRPAPTSQVLASLSKPATSTSGYKFVRISSPIASPHGTGSHSAADVATECSTPEQSPEPSTLPTRNSQTTLAKPTSIEVVTSDVAQPHTSNRIPSNLSCPLQSTTETTSIEPSAEVETVSDDTPSRQPGPSNTSSQPSISQSELVNNSPSAVCEDAERHEDAMDPSLSKPDSGSAYSVPVGQCRVCLQEGIITSFIQPCNCRGSSRWVHRECLDAWRKMSTQAYSQCDVCHAKFQFHPKPNQGISFQVCGRTLQVKPSTLTLIKDLSIFVIFLGMMLAIVKGLIVNFSPWKRLPNVIIYQLPTFTSFSPTGRTIYIACIFYKLARLFKRYVLSPTRQGRDPAARAAPRNRPGDDPAAQPRRGYVGVFSALFEPNPVGGAEEGRRGRNPRADDGAAGFQFNHNGVHVRVQGGISPFAGLFFFMGHSIVETVANTLAMQGLLSFMFAIGRFIRMSKSRSQQGDATSSPDWDVVVDLRDTHGPDDPVQPGTQAATAVA